MKNLRRFLLIIMKWASASLMLVVSTILPVIEYAHAESPQVTPPVEATQNQELLQAVLLVGYIPQAEQEVMENYDSWKLHQTLAKAYVIRFQMTKDFERNDLGLAFGEYVTALQLGAGKDLKEEFEFVYNRYRPLLGIDIPFNEFLEHMKKLYEIQEKNIRTTVNAVKDLDALYKMFQQPSNEVRLAYIASRGHINDIFRIATGRQLVKNADTGDQVILADGFYQHWNKAIRSYGFSNDDMVKVLNISDNRFPDDTMQILDGTMKGRYRTSRGGTTIIAGLKYFQNKLEGIQQSEAITVRDPNDGESVPWRPEIRGMVADRNAEVWVIVHPMEVSDYWVQPRSSVREDGSWRVIIYIGRPGSIDVGKRFEIRAIANPERELNEGDVLKYWPVAQWQSQIIEVTRE